LFDTGYYFDWFYFILCGFIHGHADPPCDSYSDISSKKAACRSRQSW